MTDFVLVHGGWHGGWCWRPTAEILRAAGHRVFAPSLTGLAERPDSKQQHFSLCCDRIAAQNFDTGLGELTLRPQLIAADTQDLPGIAETKRTGRIGQAGRGQPRDPGQRVPELSGCRRCESSRRQIAI